MADDYLLLGNYYMKIEPNTYYQRTDGRSICIDCRWKTGRDGCILNMSKIKQPERCGYYHMKDKRK